MGQRRNPSRLHSGWFSGAAGLPQYKIKNQQEREALDSLMTACQNRELRREFRQLLLSRLALISEVVSNGANPSAKSKPHKRQAENLQRQAGKCRKFAQWFDSEVDRGGVLGRIGPSSVNRELLMWAERLSQRANHLAVTKRPPLHRQHEITKQQLRLLELVRTQTGKIPWASVAALLRGATGDVGVKEKRLQSAWRAHTRSRALGARPASGRFIRRLRDRLQTKPRST